MNINNSRGAILLQVIAILGATLVAVFLLFQQVSLNRKEQTRLKILTNISVLHANYKTLLEDPKAWAATYAANTNPTAGSLSNMTCLAAKTTCTGGGHLTIFNAKGGDVYSSISASSGFTVNGDSCQQFVAPPANVSVAYNVGNDACPMRANLSWEPTCTAPCIPTQVRVQVTFAISARSADFQFPINPSNYSIDLVKDVP